MEFLQFVEHNWVLASVALMSGAMLVLPYVQDLVGGGRRIGTLAATRLINQSNAVLLDVRETKEFDGGRLPNALHIPLSQLKQRGQELAKLTKRPVLTYCSRGNASRTAAGLLKQMGFADVYELRGGMQAWKDAGLPVERG